MATAMKTLYRNIRAKTSKLALTLHIHVFV